MCDLKEQFSILALITDTSQIFFLQISGGKWVLDV